MNVKVGETNGNDADDAEDGDDTWFACSPVLAAEDGVAGDERRGWDGCHCDTEEC